MESRSTSRISTHDLTSQVIDRRIDEALQLHRDLASKGRFSDAGNVLERIAELKQMKTKAIERELKVAQAEEADEVEAQHWSEFHDFHLRWANLLKEERQASNTAISVLEAAHLKQQETYLKRLNTQMPTNFKPSAHLLNLKKQLEASIKTLKYNAAHDFQRNIAILEQREQEEHLAHREDKIKTAMAALRQKQDLEKQNLKKRLFTTMQEIKLRKKAETEKLLKRYKNYSSSLRTAQSIQVNVLTGKHTTLAGRHNPNRSLSLSRGPEDLYAEV